MYHCSNFNKIVFAVPSAPTLQLSDTQSTSVTITWMQSHQSVVDNYVIYFYESVGCGGSSPVTVTIAGTHYTLNGLEENTGYEVTITAVNSAGLSAPAVFPVYTSATSKSDKASLCLRF